MRTFFLQGSAGIGKSTLLRNTINATDLKVCSFSVQRVLRDDKKVCFQCTLNRCLPMPNVDISFENDLPDIFILDGSKNLDVLDRQISLLKKTIYEEEYDLVCLDEIGGVELKSTRFMHALRCVLESGTPCCGVFKSKANLAHTSTKLGLSDEYIALHSQLEELLSSNGILISLDDTNKDVAQAALNSFIRSCVKI